MRHFFKLILFIILLGVVAYYGYFSRNSTDTPSPNNVEHSSVGMRTDPSKMMATYVKVVQPQQSSIQEIVNSLGTVIPSQSVIVRSQVNGTLQEILFKEGQLVKQGDVLFKIDSRSYQAALDQAKGALAQNQAKLVNARQDLKRYQILFKQDSIARQEVDTQQALVREYEASRQSLQAAVEQAQINLDDTMIRAPMDGRVGLRTVDVGNLVTANSTEGLVTITQTQPIDVTFAIPDRYISKLAQSFYANQPLKVEAFNKNNAQSLAQGDVVSMDNQVDTTTGTIKLKARFENKQYTLFPNQFVNISLVLSTVENTLVLSNDAIQYGDQGAFVYVVQKDMTVKVTPVQLGIVNNGLTQIVSGLTATDNVVVEGLDRLRDGVKVEIVK